MNKRANLLTEETLKIVIAVICIILLVSLLFGIYNSYTKNKNLEMAKATLNKFDQAVSLKYESFDIFNPTLNFYFVSWDDGIGLPDSCSNVGWASCVCICSQTLIQRGTNYILRRNILDSLRKECSNWACIENKNKVFLVKGFEELKTSPASFQIKYLDDGSAEVFKK